jgi:hypothetical protein
MQTNLRTNAKVSKVFTMRRFPLVGVVVIGDCRRRFDFIDRQVHSIKLDFFD